MHARESALRVSALRVSALRAGASLLSSAGGRASFAHASILAMLLTWPLVASALEYRPRVAEVVRVIDGDSFLLRFPGAEGDERIEYRANLIGVDAPGRGEAECEAEFVTAIARRLLLDREVWIEWDSHDRRTDDGRLLVYVAHPEDHDDVLNALYIEQGWGWVPRAWPFDRKEEYLELERNAREQLRGIWGGPCPPSP